MLGGLLTTTGNDGIAITVGCVATTVGVFGTCSAGALFCGPFVTGTCGLAVKRGNQAVLNYLNAWVTAHWADNLLPSLARTWFSGDEWTRNLKPAAK